MSGSFELGSGQQAFDLDVLLREQVSTQTWTGAPLGYTADYYTPAQLEAAFDRYVAEHGNFGCLINSHMWHSGYARPFEAGSHSMHLLMAAGDCAIADHDHLPAELPGAEVYQSNCTNCRWHSIHTCENGAVEAWHDHALPGWRDLPVVPTKLTKPGWDMERRSAAAVAAWVQQHMPTSFTRPGCPILTYRSANASRHVPNRSPMGGYDIAVVDPSA